MDKYDLQPRQFQSVCVLRVQLVASGFFLLMCVEDVRQRVVPIVVRVLACRHPKRHPSTRHALFLHIISQFVQKIKKLEELGESYREVPLLYCNTINGSTEAIIQ